VTSGYTLPARPARSAEQPERFDQLTARIHPQYFEVVYVPLFPVLTVIDTLLLWGGYRMYILQPV